MKQRLLRLIDRRTFLAVLGSVLIFVLGWRFPSAIPECASSIAIISLALGGSNAVQQAAVAFANRGRKVKTKGGSNAIPTKEG